MSIDIACLTGYYFVFVRYNYIQKRGEFMDMEEKFAERLAQLRTIKRVSARDMSLSLGQSTGYINNIENKNNLPSMSAFFYICEYLNIEPRDFFDFDLNNPEKLNGVIANLKKLTDEELNHISEVINDLTKSR